MTVKLSELADDVMVFQDEETPLSVKDLRHELKNGFEKRIDGWQIAEPEFWTPSAKSMVEGYAENEAENLYEDAYVRLIDELSPLIDQIQALMFGIKIPYYIGGDKVEIDAEVKAE